MKLRDWEEDTEELLGEAGDGKRRKGFRTGEKLLLVLCAAVALLSAFFLYRIFAEYAAGKAVYGGLEQYVFLPEETAGTPAQRTDKTDAAGANGTADETGAADGEDAAEEAAGHSWLAGGIKLGTAPTVDFSALCGQNSDTAAWLYAAGSAINYPVVQGTDNEFYLTHMFDGTKNKCGSIFMDCLNAKDFSDQNTILHGHHMRNGSMFAGLLNYKEQEYYDTHPQMWLVTPEETFRVEIFTAFVTTAEGDPWQIAFATQEDYGAWLGRMADASIFSTDVVPQQTDRILTLSTCSYEYDDARFVVMGILHKQ